MNKQLFLADTKYQLSFKDMIEKTEKVDIGILKNKQYKHSYPLENYSGISIITTEKNLDEFLQTIFPKTKLTSKKLIVKLEKHSEYMVLHNNHEIRNIMDEIRFSNREFWKEKVIIKFAELMLLLINSDIEFLVNEKYYDKRMVNIVKGVKEEVTSNMETYTKIEEVSRKYNISSKAFSECFKAIYGKTYYAFVKEFRIKKSAELLRLNKLTIGEISIMVGYQNASKFSKAFFDVMGVTPICYRKNNSFTVLD